MAVDSSGNIIAVGTAENATVNGSSTYDQDMIVAKYSPAGVFSWVKALGTETTGYSGRDSAQSVALDGDGNLFVIGAASRPISAGISEIDDYNAFICRYSPEGTPDKIMDIMPDISLWPPNNNVIGISVSLASADAIYISINVDSMVSLPITDVIEGTHDEVVLLRMIDLKSIY